MRPWRASRYWRSAHKRRFAAFIFGCAAHLERPVYVLERGEGGVLDPLRVYGERDADGALRRTAGGVLMRQRPLRPVAPRFEARDRDAASVTNAPLLRASSWHAMSQSDA